jgi:hypothetical protein
MSYIFSRRGRRGLGSGSGDSGGLTPADLTRGLWFDATDAATLSLSTLAVNSVTDKKQSLVISNTGSNRPNQSATAQIGGLKTLEFRAGVNQWLGASNVPFATYYTSGDFTAIQVFKYVGDGSQGGMLMGMNTSLANIMSQLLPFELLGNLYFDYGNAASGGRVFGTTPVGFSGAYHIVTSRYKASTGIAEIRVDGVLVGVPLVLTDAWEPATLPFEIGRVTGVNSYQSHMDWAESIMPDQYVSDADMNNLGNNYLFNKYGIAWTDI